MKRAILVAGITMMLIGSVSAMEPVTLNGKMDKLDSAVFGGVQNGSLIHRVDAVDSVIYGKSRKGDGLDERVSNLYSEVIHDDEGETPSLGTRANALEYYITDGIKQTSLEERVQDMESTVFGAAKTGPLNKRINELEKEVYGNRHFAMQNIELPANTVFKIALNEDVGTKTNEEGDSVSFTVEEDVVVGNVLVLPKGAQGSGVVTKVVKPRSFGRSGSLDIAFDQVFSIDEEEIPTVLGPEAREKLKMEAAAVGASAVGALALGPIGLVGGFFVKGKDVEMPAGSTLYIQTKETVQTRGMVMVPGEPELILNEKVSSSAKQEDAKKDTKTLNETEVINLSKDEKGVVKVKNAGKMVSENNKAVSANNKDEKTEENIKKDSSKENKKESKTLKDDDDISMVIVRND